MIRECKIIRFIFSEYDTPGRQKLVLLKACLRCYVTFLYWHYSKIKEHAHACAVWVQRWCWRVLLRSISYVMFLKWKKYAMLRTFEIFLVHLNILSHLTIFSLAIKRDCEFWEINKTIPFYKLETETFIVEKIKPLFLCSSPRVGLYNISFLSISIINYKYDKAFNWRDQVQSCFELFLQTRYEKNKTSLDKDKKQNGKS